MYKKTVKFKNLNDIQIEQTLHFNYTRPELIRLAAVYGGDVAEQLTALAKSGNFGQIIDTLEDLILSAYGIPSVDGNRFDKSPQLRADFENSLAYAQLFEEIVMDGHGMDEFTKGVLSGIADISQEEIDAVKTQQPVFEVVKPPQQDPNELLQALANDPVLMAQLAKKVEEGKK